jgi:hypothetical protein
MVSNGGTRVDVRGWGIFGACGADASYLRLWCACWDVVSGVRIHRWLLPLHSLDGNVWLADNA